jgi:drug/metabolite transporter (DMT)-like permease
VSAVGPAGQQAARDNWRVDLLLVTMVFIWGANYSVIKHAFSEVPPQPFNALRLLLAGSVYLTAILTARRRALTTGVSSVFYTPAPLTRRDRWDLVWLGLVGHTCYQTCFVGGVNLTSVSNAALIIGATPVVVAILSALLGRERIGPFHWLGAAVSGLGIYFVVGHGAAIGGPTWRGDMLIMVSVCCWAVYTIGSSRLLARHSPLFVTGTTMVLGAVPYALIMSPQVFRVHWTQLSHWTLGSLVVSALMALNVAYLIWYTGVQRLGPARTSIFSNVVPVAAMTVAGLWLHEPIGRTKVIGAAGVLGGVLLTRIRR